MYGTASEHSVFYQYQFYQASDVLAAMIQTETPYYQPNPPPPAPFQASIGAFTSDPPLQYCSTGEDGCDASWTLRIIESSNIIITGAGLYSFFQAYNEACVNTQNCQLALVQIETTNGGVYIYNLVTLGAVSMVNALSDQTTEEILAIPNTNSVAYPWWSLITVLEPVAVSDGSSSNGSDVNIDPSIWTSTAPVVQCEPPCAIILPPYPLSFTTTITWPTLTTTLLSSSKGSMYTTTTTIKFPKVTTSFVAFWAITVNADDPPSATFYQAQSVMPPSTVITLPGTLATFPPTQYPDFPIGGGGLPSPTSSSSSSTIVPVFFSTRHPVTIQAQPTISISTPPPVVPVVTFSSGKPKPTCTHNCGYHNCGLFGCGTGCGIFGCDHGCGIFGCGHGCGLFGCGADCLPLIGCSLGCPLNLCGGPGCKTDNCGYGQNGDGEKSTSCTTITTTGCSTMCYATPSTCSTTCTTDTQCKHTATNTAITVTDTLASFAVLNPERWPTTKKVQSDYDAASAGILSLILSLHSAAGTSFGYSSMSVTSTQPPSTTSPPPSKTSNPIQSSIPYVLEAICTAVAQIADTAVTIWINYITDNGNALVIVEMDNAHRLLTGPSRPIDILYRR
jgi:hypothetical protein